MNKLSDNEIKDIRDTIKGLTVGDTLIVDCKKELSESVIDLVIETGKGFGYEFYINVYDYFSKVEVKRID